MAGLGYKLIFVFLQGPQADDLLSNLIFDGLYLFDEFVHIGPLSAVELTVSLVFDVHELGLDVVFAHRVDEPEHGDEALQLEIIYPFVLLADGDCQFADFERFFLLPFMYVLQQFLLSCYVSSPAPADGEEVVVLDVFEFFEAGLVLVRHSLFHLLEDVDVDLYFGMLLLKLLPVEFDADEVSLDLPHQVLQLLLAGRFD